MSVPFLDAAEIARRLTPLAAVDALEAAVRADPFPAGDPPRAAVGLDGGQLLVMPSGAGRRPVVKVLTVGGDPRIQGLCVAFDPQTLAPVAILDAIGVTNLRTAAVSALAVRHLAAPDARRLVVLGRGPQAHAHVEAIRAVRPIEHVELLGRADGGDDGRRDALVAGADVVCCCTTARTPLFAGTLVADRATVVAIGSHEPEAREVDDALVARTTVVVETPGVALREAGDVIQAVAAGAIAPDALVPLAAVVRGEHRPDPARPRLFKSVGVAWEDAVVVDAILAAAG